MLVSTPTLPSSEEPAHQMNTGLRNFCCDGAAPVPADHVSTNRLKQHFHVLIIGTRLTRTKESSLSSNGLGLVSLLWSLAILSWEGLHGK